MNNNFFYKKNKYLRKIEGKDTLNKFTFMNETEEKIKQSTSNNFTFNNETEEKIKKVIKYYEFLKYSLNKNTIELNTNMNDTIVIEIKIGDNYMSQLVPYNNALATDKNLTSFDKIDKLTEEIQNQEIQNQETQNQEIQNQETQNQETQNQETINMNDEMYDDIINNAVILGYIFLQKLNKKIGFCSLQKVNPVFKKIITMVLELNK